jgi:hypothetical protein
VKLVDKALRQKTIPGGSAAEDEDVPAAAFLFRRKPVR